jgi:hypothetical protein
MTQDPAYLIPGDKLATPTVARRINIGRLWAGGVATAVVSALLVLVGVLIARQLLGTPALSSKTNSGYADGTVVKYALLAAAAALAATILMHLLLFAVPQPARFFSWIVGLITAAATILPFTMAGPTDPKFASALINLLVGIAIGVLLGSIAAGCIARVSPNGIDDAPTIV